MSANCGEDQSTTRTESQHLTWLTHSPTHFFTQERSDWSEAMRKVDSEENPSRSAAGGNHEHVKRDQFNYATQCAMMKIRSSFFKIQTRYITQWKHGECKMLDKAYQDQDRHRDLMVMTHRLIINQPSVRRERELKISIILNMCSKFGRSLPFQWTLQCGHFHEIHVCGPHLGWVNMVIILSEIPLVTSLRKFKRIYTQSKFDFLILHANKKISSYVACHYDINGQRKRGRTWFCHTHTRLFCEEQVSM